MQVDVGQQGRSYSPLRCPHLRLRPDTVLRHPGFQPFLDQPEYSSVGDAVLEKPQHPLVVHVIEEPPNVRIQHPVHLPPLHPNYQGIQRLMLAAPWPGPIREAQKVHLIYLVEDGDHGLLNNLVLQRSRCPTAAAGRQLSVYTLFSMAALGKRRGAPGCADRGCDPPARLRTPST